MAERIKSLEQLRKIREGTLKKMSVREGKYRFKVTIPMGTSGIAAGAREVLKAFLDAIEKHDLTDVVVAQTGFVGSKTIQPVAIVEDVKGNKVTYGNLDPDKVGEIVARHIVKGETVREYVVIMPLE